MTAAIRTLSLGAGVQSTALVLLACEGMIAPFDAAIFADTGWEPKKVYDHLDRLTEYAADHGLPIYRVSVGNIRNDALDPEHRFASMPLFVRNPDGSDGMARRQCTSEYKLKPIKAKTRDLLGFPYPTSVPKGVYAETAIGISMDEIGRARDSDVQYMRNVFPLLDLGWARKECERFNRSRGWTTVAKSACIGCPYHGNRQWRELRDESPEEFADAVAFDAAIRNGSARANAAGKDLRGSMYLHRSRVPLDVAPIDRVTYREWADAQGDIFDELAEMRLEDGDPDGCSPWACRSGEAVTAPAPPVQESPNATEQSRTEATDA